MKRLLLLILITGQLLSIPVTGYTGPKEDYEEAYKIYLAAGASAAAYNGRIGELANRYLAQEGWQIDHYVQDQGQTGARYLIAQKPGVSYYLVAIVGTENRRDVKIDLKVDKVYFSGENPSEFIANANKKNIPDTEPKVHKGFNEFVQAGPSARLRNPRYDSLALPVLLQTDQTCKLYLTGHSLGGAAATLAGARLLSAGVSPEQLEVITFGAPAVGNAAFAAKFNSVLPLTRIVNSGDAVTGVLQTLVGGYQQFGKSIKWDTPDTLGDPHQLTSYLDAALKNYYEKRHLAVAAGMQLPPPPATITAHRTPILLLPLQNNLPSALQADFWYMNEALLDEYRHTFPNYVLAENQTVSDDWRQTAAASGCRWAIVSEVSASRVKEKRDIYYITITQTVYDTKTGAVADIASFSSSNDTLTPLEAFIHAFKDMNGHTSNRFTDLAASTKLNK
ncbi:lipase family protein [Sporomusa aerivorans]|uniref:lipase family protein n=1 Tax=Sporomusa aerivorans TaxID=204936 RepID=UPI00352B48D1